MTSASDGPAARVLHDVVWQRLDQPGFEICRLWQRDDALRLEGTIHTIAEGVPAELSYEVTCDRTWATRAVRVALRRGPSPVTVELRREEGDRWWRDGVRMAELDGTTDIDLGFTPATNTLPIRRLHLAVGASHTIQAAWVRFPELSVAKAAQTYTRLDEFTYRYESGTFSAELVVDDDGLVAGYAGWRRTGLAMGADDREPLDAQR